MLCEFQSMSNVSRTPIFALSLTGCVNDPFLTHTNSFGKVVAGSDVVSAIEQVGSESGATRVPVVIADSGQLR